MLLAKRNLKLLNGLINHKRIANAYLFSGPIGSFLKKSAEYFVLGVNCTHFTDSPCYKCVNCETVSQKKAVDYYLLDIEGKIKIEKIREIQDFVKYGPAIANYLFVVINNVQNFTREAANAFLKTLEEPLKGVTFILLTHNEKDVLTTIKSRCQKIDLVSISNQELKGYLASKPKEETAAWLEKCLNDDFLLKCFLETDVLPELDEYITYDEFRALDKFSRLGYAYKLALYSKQQIELYFNLWLKSIFRKIEEVSVKDQENIEMIIENMAKLKYNINLKLNLESLFLKL